MDNSLKYSHQRFALWGLLMGLVCAVLGSAIYTCVKLVEITINLGLSEVLGDPLFGIVIFGYSFIFSLLPSVFGGGLLGYILAGDVKSGRFSRKAATKKGLILGALMGLGMVISVVIHYGYRVTTAFIVSEGIKGLILASLAGYWTGYQLGKRIAKYQSKN